MTVVTDPNLIAGIIRRVQAALDRRQPAAYRIEVQPDGVLEEEGLYQVIVGTRQDVRSYDFYNVLAEAEAELEEKEKLHVLLVPVVGD